jgi:two-component system, OmpR family, response regulator MprA
MPRDSSSIRILVVDDDDTIRATIAEALELDGFIVETASNGAEAWVLVSERPPSGILLDLMMPVMNGWQFLEKCRAAGVCDGTPVVIMSAYHKLSSEVAKLGVSGYVSKPFDLDVLLGEVERALDTAAA